MGAVPVVAVLGDSVATSLGLAESRGHWPSVIRASRPDLRVVSFAKVASQIDDSATRIDEIIDTSPNAVVIAHGGRECLVRTTTALRLIKTDPDQSLEFTPRGIVRGVRRAIYRRVLGELTHERRRVLTPFMRLRPNLDAERFTELFDEIVKAVLERTAAPIFVLVPHGYAMGFHPWSTAAVTAVQAHMSACGERHARVIVVDTGDGFASDASAYQFDGVHFSPDGHRRVAEALLEAMDRALPTAAHPLSG